MRGLRLQTPQQGGEIRQGSEAAERDAPLLQGQDLLFHTLPASVELSLDGAGGDLKELRNLLDGQTLKVEQADHELLLPGETADDLPHLSGDLLPVQGQLRLMLLPGIGQLGLPAVLSPQVRKAQRLLPGQLRDGDVNGDAPQPGHQGLRVPQLFQTGPRPEISILLDVPGQVVVTNHGVNGAVKLGAGQGVELGEGVPISRAGLFHQRPVEDGRVVACGFFHCRISHSFSSFLHSRPID